MPPPTDTDLEAARIYAGRWSQEHSAEYPKPDGGVGRITPTAAQVQGIEDAWLAGAGHARADERERLAGDLRELLTAALGRLGVTVAGRGDNSRRWSSSDLVTDLEPLLAEAIRKGPQS